MSRGALRVENRLHERVRLVGFEIHGATIRDRAPTLDEDVARTCVGLCARFADPPSAASWTEPARRLYRSLGIDPSKRRPSSEALLRRVLQGKGLYTVNTAVDAANLASLEIALPVGLYDRDRIEARADRIVLRLGDAGERYEGIRKDEVNVHERPTLADDEGPFGNPSADSARTQVLIETGALLFVAYAPIDLAGGELLRQGETARSLLLRHVGGEAGEVWSA